MDPRYSGSPGGQSPNRGTSFDLHQREIIRIHELWTKAKQELKSKAHEIDQLRARLRVLEADSVQSTMQHQELARYQSTLHGLADKLRSVSGAPVCPGSRARGCCNTLGCSAGMVQRCAHTHSVRAEAVLTPIVRRQQLALVPHLPRCASIRC